MSKIIFVTGTDTGVGKTLLTGLLLAYLRDSGVNALAMKPFCSGGTDDVDFIQAIQGNALPPSEVNPFYFPRPIAPLIAAREAGRRIRLREALEAIRRVERRCERLIVEGSGGLLVPLGEDFHVGDVVRNLDCDVIVVGRDRLGTINHTSLTVEALHLRGVKRIKVILMRDRSPDVSSRSNAAILREILGKTEVFRLPWLGANASSFRAVKKNLKKLKKTLATICGADSFSVRSSGRLQKTQSCEATEKRKKDR